MIRPQPGFQEQALGCDADIGILGGSAGCGKSWCSVAEPLRYVHLPGFSAVIFRRTHPELKGGGSVWDQAERLYPHFGGISRLNSLDWTFPSGATVKFSHLQHERDRFSHQSKEYALIVFEEGTHFTEEQFWYLTSRARTTCGVQPYVRLTCNPDPNSFVADLVGWWIGTDGYPLPERAGKKRWFLRVNDVIHWHDDPNELIREFGHNDYIPNPQSMTFIPGRLDDNQILMSKDPAYRGRLEALPLVERERLLAGNWKIKPAAGLYFQRGYFKILEGLSKLELHGAQIVRFWDKAATEATGKNDPSWTVGVKMARLADGRYVVLDVERFRGTPNTVDVRMRNVAEQDGLNTTQWMFQDPGQAGKVDVAHTKIVLDGFTLRAYKVVKDKITLASPVSSQAEGGNIYLLQGAWNNEYLSELINFPDGKHDDQVDATSGAFKQLQRKKLIFL